MDSSIVLRQRKRASVEASFQVSLPVPKVKKPRTTVNKLILPCAKDSNRILIKKAESKLNIYHSRTVILKVGSTKQGQGFHSYICKKFRCEFRT